MTTFVYIDHRHEPPDRVADVPKYIRFGAQLYRVSRVVTELDPQPVQHVVVEVVP